MILVLRKIAQLNIKYREKWGPLKDICAGPHLTERSYGPGEELNFERYFFI